MEVTLVGNGCRQEKAASFCASSSPAPYPILQALGHTAAADINFNFLITIPNITLYSYQGLIRRDLIEEETWVLLKREGGATGLMSGILPADWPIVYWEVGGGELIA